jgi:hypothetical protein
MSNEENFDKIFSEITSPENLGEMPKTDDDFIISNQRDYALILAELITAIQEINLIVINLTDPDDEETMEVPLEIINSINNLYESAKSFNNSMLNLDQSNVGYFLFIEEDDNEDNDDNF